MVEMIAKKYPQTFAYEIDWTVDPMVMLMNDVKKTVAAKAKVRSGFSRRFSSRSA